MTAISGNPWSRRRVGYGLLAGGLLSATASVLIALPTAHTANADPSCNETVGNSIDSYLKRHPDVKRDLAGKSKAEGGGSNVLDYLNRHPDVRQKLITLSQQCTP